jgi:hypothetical protein
MAKLPKAEAHRAMADVRESRAHWLKCKEFVALAPWAAK